MKAGRMGAFTALLSLAVASAGNGPVALRAQPAPPRTVDAAGPASEPFLTGIKDAASFERLAAARLARARETLDRVIATKTPRTIENTLRPYDDVLLELDAVGSQANLLENVHPDETTRKTAETISQKANTAATELSLNRGVYDAIAKLDVSADPETRYYVQRTLRDFRLSGVDKDEATRKRIQELNDELTIIGQEFSRNIRSDQRKVIAKNAAELDGLPADFMARHKPEADGTIVLTIEYPDSLPVFSYARNEDLRKRMYVEYNNRGYPANMEVLDRMIARRAELARLVGYSNWADYITANKMVGSAKNASDFIDRIVAASGPKADREYEALLKRKKEDVPDATIVNAWESTYYAELVRKSSYDFDSQSVRPYFPFDRVKQGMLDVTSRLFGLTYRPLKDAPVWDKSVEAYDVVQDGRMIGRFYLDMHPRPNKYNHAAQFPIRTGVGGRQIPEAALVCNLPGGDPADPGLMTHDDVTTFFHEFGHLIHTLVSGRHQWIGIGGIATEQDFAEAPSQMLEEWTWDPTTLATFAKQYQTNQPIPAPLVNQMRRASEFGKGLQVRRQMVYARYSLSVYDRDPKEVDTTKLYKDIMNQYQRTPYVDGTHFQTSFGHLDGYSAVYYTYMWSLVIAKDLFAHFNQSNLLDTEISRKYRDTVLAPGGAKPAADLVRDFLGRPFDFKAWETWLNREQ
jgi:thimet oligopeptidase